MTMDADAAMRSAVGAPLQRRVMQPSERVRRALARLSRDRWLSGEEVSALVASLCRCTGVRNPWVIERFCVEPGAIGIGLIRGALPVSLGHPEYRQTLLKLNRAAARKDRGARPELLILQAQLSNLVRYGWT